MTERDTSDRNAPVNAPANAPATAPADAFGDDMLEALFAEARAAETPALPDALSARMMADAAAALAPPPASRPNWWARLRLALADIGGAPGLAGVSAAGLAGVWIGFSGSGGTGALLTQFWQGAATVSPSVSEWVETDPLTDDSSTLWALMSGEIE
ncbi:hypothetical protein [Pararhodobacter oceanensis]|uniref:hypothetical protein n=1 Tax=Pararhodobacter oceanensis TaxID=2172121 RepID=UPI003A8C97D6